MTQLEKLETLKSVSEFLKDAFDLQENNIVKVIAKNRGKAKIAVI